MKTTKSIFASKTFWLNLVMGIIAVSTYIDPSLLAAIGIETENQQKVLTAVGSITAILNIILRVVTAKPVDLTMKKQSKQ